METGAAAAAERVAAAAGLTPEAAAELLEVSQQAVLLEQPELVDAAVQQVLVCPPARPPTRRQAHLHVRFMLRSVL